MLRNAKWSLELATVEFFDAVCGIKRFLGFSADFLRRPFLSGSLAL